MGKEAEGEIAKQREKGGAGIGDARPRRFYHRGATVKKIDRGGGGGASSHLRENHPAVAAGGVALPGQSGTFRAHLESLRFG
ncbi:hypothetical protein GMST_33570 [Geomonas silvestris]|uniref:Uncharacterized protein n=1 Tax=Geomonas silvestris TaxID=2740184 RepID=A0A6V8MM40_9BACT|nr:hypothetical protein GMST_33570 [Geomonas silvestris]